MRLARHRSKRNDEGSLWDAMKEDERKIVLTMMQVPEQFSAVAYIQVSKYIRDSFSKLAKESI